jgi:hypothetical protein
MKKEITYWLMSIIASVFLMDALVYFGYIEALVLTIVIFALCVKATRSGTKLPDFSAFICGGFVITFFFTFVLSLPMFGYIDIKIVKDFLSIIISASTIIILLFTLLGLGFEELSPTHTEIPKYTLGNKLYG